MNARGAALPLVLWGIAFLGALVILVASRMNEGMDEESQAGRMFRARQLALRGLAIARHPGIAPGDPLLASGSPDSEGFQVRFTDESGRLNPNVMLAQGERQALLALFTAWGAPQRLAEAATDSLADWADPDDFRSLAGAEASEYLREGLRGLPPNAPLRNLQEMELVMNLRDILAAKEGWRNYFTVLHEGKININHAEEPLLRDLAGLEETQTRRIMDFLAGADKQRDTEDDGEFSKIEDAVAVAGASGPQAAALGKWVGVEGGLRRIESTGFCAGVRRTISAVVSEDGREILAWEEH
ncbi:MAG: general secretion pathway protein GspK [Terrimicrobiaceae bacterium]|nr:general secretion pathway protein GspK [Terrimicrobiaceae bacterium]